MKILALDTSTKFLSLGVYIDGKIYEYNLEVGHKLSSLLAVTIERVIKALELKIQDIDYFSCGLGPGSFTGMRVGLSAFKGFALALRKPLIGISTLDILAVNAATDKMIVPVIDAKRGLIYSAFYKNRNSSLKRLSRYMLISKEQLLSKIDPDSLIFGDAIDLYKDEILKKIPCAKLLDKDYWYPKAHNIISLALESVKGKKFIEASKINPIYIYPKECQIKHVSRR